MRNNELNYYDEIKNWDFSKINYETEHLTNWNMYEILNEKATKQSRILDLGTGGGEKVTKEFPDALEIIGTDFSPEMIKTANENLKKSNKKNIKFRVMNNLKMDTLDNYFDIVVARHTCVDAKQIYKTLKKNGILILRVVDKLDCWQLKRLFNRGQAFQDTKPISQIDYENITKKDIDLQKLEEYIANNTTSKGILLRRRYYGIVANK